MAEKKKSVSFIIKKQFETSEKTYKIGDTFTHSDESVINYLKLKNII